MAAPVETNDVLSDAEIGQLESWLFEFDRSWTDDAFDKRINELPQGSAALQQQILVEAVKIDMERQWQNSREQTVENYLERLPQLQQPETVVGRLIETEIEIRRQCGSNVDPVEWAQRFPSHADRLKELCGTGGDSSINAKPAVRETVRPAANADSVAENKASTADEMPEQFGRYHILRQLGEGAMGAVYLAKDSQLKRQVALKTPTFDGNGAREMVDRFYSEAQSAATLRHPNICPVYDVGEIDGRHFISMAYIEGRMLSQYIQSGKQIPERAVAALIRKLARGLGHAHKAGVIHRDLKPGNVIIDQQNEPIVMDFGLARRVDQRNESRITQDGIILGTPAYMSPEQVQGKLDATGPHSDIYSLGIMLYELLTGELPFDGPIVSVLAQIMTQDPQSPSSIRKGIDPRLETICLKMIAKKPQDRFASMKEVSNALAAFLKGESPLAKIADEETADKRRTPESTPAKRQTVPAVSATMVGNDEMQALAKMFDAQVSDAQPIVEAIKRPRRASTVTNKTWIILATAAAACVVLAGILLSIGSDKGTIKLELPDGVAVTDIRLVIDGTNYTLPRGGLIELEPGQHKVEVFHNGRRLSTGTLAIVSGTINSVAVPVPAVIPKRKKQLPPPPSDDRNVAQWLFDTGSYFKFRTADGVVHTRWNRQKKKKSKSSYTQPLPDEPFVLISIWFYAGTGVTDGDMTKLRNLTSLEVLVFASSAVTSRGLEHVKQLSRLRTLDLRSVRVSGDGFRVVGEMKQLKALSVRGIKNNELAHLSGMTGLTSLNIYSKHVSDAGLEPLAKLTNLETLFLTSGAITGAGLTHLKGMTRLRSLSLADTSLVDSGLVHLEGLTTLQGLNLSATRVTDAGTPSIARLTGLTSLLLDNTVVGDAGLEHLSGLIQINRLGLTGTRVTNQGLSYLREFRKMEVLYANGTGIDDEGLAHLRDMTLLKRLYAANTNVTGTGLGELSDHTNLSWLVLGGSNFTEKAAALNTLKQLKSRLGRLYLYGVDLTDSERDDLQKAVGQGCRIVAGKVDLDEEVDPDGEAMPLGLQDSIEGQ